ncbi:efflux RND transporter periplasmic adaptor subunit [soil metagenome]
MSTSHSAPPPAQADEVPPPPEDTTSVVKKSAVAMACGAVVLATVAIVAGFVHFRPVAEKETPARIVPAVEVVEAVRSTLQVVVGSQGTIVPKTSTDVASEVGGRIVWVADAFERGGQFSEGDELLKIDPANYEAALAQARADLEDSRLALQLEEARKVQAERDWEKLGGTGAASDLVLREPQVAAAQAAVAAAEAKVSKAQRDLAQTVIVAPYDGRVRRTATDLGSYVNVGSPLAEIYASDGFEVALPLSLAEFDFLPTGAGGTIQVRLRRPGKAREWEARIDRIEGEVDALTRTVTAIAVIEDAQPLGLSGGDFLGPGLFVEASIDGVTLRDVISLPRQVMFDPETILLADAESRLQFRKVTVLRAEPDRVILGGDPAHNGLQGGERVVRTTLSAPIQGMPVQVIKSGAEEGSADPRADSPPAEPEGDIAIKP